MKSQFKNLILTDILIYLKLTKVLKMEKMFIFLLFLIGFLNIIGTEAARSQFLFYY